MRYRATVKNGDKETTILNGQLSLSDPVVSLGCDNMPNTFTFCISPAHPAYKLINPLSSEIFVYEDGVEIFRGRSISSSEDIQLTGQVTCESDIAYLCDTIIRPYDKNTSIINFMKFVIDEHNKQVEERKRFRVGTISVVDENNIIRRWSADYSTSFAVLKDKLVASHGGYFRTRMTKGVRYIDYLVGQNEQSAQEIRYGRNLISMIKNIDATEVFTALIPTGAKKDVQIAGGGTKTEIVTIESENGGKDYIYDQSAVDKYGWIFRRVEWSDVATAKTLLAKAKAYLAEHIYLPAQMTVSAVDLKDLGADMDSMDVGSFVRVVSKPHGINSRFKLTRKSINLLDPSKCSVELGGTARTSTGSAADSFISIANAVKDLEETTSVEMLERIENARQLITGGLGGYVVIGGNAKDGHPEEILVMDNPDKSKAKNVIRFNQNGIGFSNNGYKGPFNSAWTIDGSFNAKFITTGEMLADRIRGGTFEVGGTGTGKDGEIKILNKDGKLIGEINSDGVAFYAGEIKLGQDKSGQYNFQVTPQGRVIAKLLEIDGVNQGATLSGTEVIALETLQSNDGLKVSGYSDLGDVGCTGLGCETLTIGNTVIRENTLQSVLYLEDRVTRLENAVF